MLNKYSNFKIVILIMLGLLILIQFGCMEVVDEPAGSSSSPRVTLPNSSTVWDFDDATSELRWSGFTSYAIRYGIYKDGKELLSSKLFENTGSHTIKWGGDLMRNNMYPVSVPTDSMQIKIWNDDGEVAWSAKFTMKD